MSDAFINLLFFFLGVAAGTMLGVGLFAMGGPKR